MANTNWQSFLMGTVASLVGYAAQKLAEPNAASWVETRKQIYSDGLQAAAQELAVSSGMRL